MPNHTPDHRSNEERGLCRYPNPDDPTGPWLKRRAAPPKPPRPKRKKRAKKKAKKRS